MLRIIGNHTLLARLATTHAGEAFRALDKRGQRETRVKVGRAGKCELRAADEAITALEHAGIAPVIEAGSSPEGEPVVVSAWRSGRPLSEVVTRYDGDWRQIAHLVREVAIALDAAHERGVTHGDVCEDTIIIGDDDLPVLTDFGLGLRLNAPTNGSPEGRERKFKLDQRADLFALGCVLYLLLSGKPASEQPAGELSDPNAPHDDIAPIDAAAPLAPTELRAICGQATSTDPVYRYLNAASLVRDLDQYLYGKRSKPVVKIGLIVIGALMVGLFGLWGTVGGGPARIIDAALTVNRGHDGAIETIGAASGALTVDDSFGVHVQLSKAAFVTVAVRLPTGEVRILPDGQSAKAARRVYDVPRPDDASGRLWGLGTQGGTVVVIVLSHGKRAPPEDLVTGLLATAGDPPEILSPCVWFGEYIPSGPEPVMLEMEGVESKSRFKTAGDYAANVRKQLAAHVDDVVVAVGYVIGA